MFVLVHNSRVIVGPINWNRALFDGNLEKLKIKAVLPRTSPENFPIVIDANTTIRRAIQDYPSYNAKTHYLEGPYWDLTTADAVAKYHVRPQPLESVKARLKETVAENRWKKEVAGTKTTIQNIEVTVDTARGNRDVFVQKFLLMGDADVVTWKFPEAWLQLTKADLGAVVSAGAAHVESCFAWEAAKGYEIDSCVDLDGLNSVNLEV